MSQGMSCCICSSSTLQEMLALGLDEGIVCAAQYGLCLSKRVDLTGAGFLAHIEILEEPVALVVDVLDCCCQFLSSGGFGVCVLLKLSLHVCQGTLLILEALGVLGPLLCRVLHHLLVVTLSVLLFCLCDGHLLVEVLDQEIDHGNHSIGLLTLLLEGTRGLWWWWRLSHAMGRDIGQDCDTSSSNATWSLSWCQGATCCESCAILVSQLALWGRLVERRIIKLVEPVLCETKDLLCCRVRCHELGEVLILLLSLVSGFSDSLVQGLDACGARFDFVLLCGNAILGIGNSCVQV